MHKFFTQTPRQTSETPSGLKSKGRDCMWSSNNFTLDPYLFYFELFAFIDAFVVFKYIYLSRGLSQINAHFRHIRKGTARG